MRHAHHPGQGTQRGGGARAGGNYFRWTVGLLAVAAAYTFGGQARCPGGRASGSGATACDVCAAGTFAEPGSSSCAPCAPGKYSYNESASCADCAAGGFSGSGATQCEVCGPGRYTDESGLPSCGLADAGYFVDPDDPSVEKPCPAGTSSGSGSTGCTPCAPGTFSGEGDPTCTSCGQNEVSAGGSTECDPCPEDYFSEPGASVCEQCPSRTSRPQNETACIAKPRDNKNTRRQRRRNRTTLILVLSIIGGVLATIFLLWACYLLPCRGPSAGNLCVHYISDVQLHSVRTNPLPREPLSASAILGHNILVLTISGQFGL